jgi:glycosyltransferase involved in cell wall biosynthesis
MEDRKRYLIIIPVYNEEKNIGRVLDKTLAINLPFEILVIDDGSMDDTRKIVREKGIQSISHAFNLGYGAALHTGLMYAEKHDYEALITMDGDGQHDPSEITKLTQCYDKTRAKVVIGSRFFKGSSYRASFFRNMGRILFSNLAFLITKRKIKDVTSGFQMISTEAIKFLAKSDFPSDYPDANILILLELSGFKIQEIPVKMYSIRSKDSIHYGLKPLFYIYKMLLSIVIILLNKKNLQAKTLEIKG